MPAGYGEATLSLRQAASEGAVARLTRQPIADTGASARVCLGTARRLHTHAHPTMPHSHAMQNVRLPDTPHTPTVHKCTPQTHHTTLCTSAHPRHTTHTLCTSAYSRHTIHTHTTPTHAVQHTHPTVYTPHIPTHTAHAHHPHKRTHDKRKLGTPPRTSRCW